MDTKKMDQSLNSGDSPTPSDAPRKSKQGQVLIRFYENYSVKCKANVKVAYDKNCS